jgi:hypothetical protein
MPPSNYRAYKKQYTADDAVAITFDVDWAPDWCVQICYDLCKSAGCGATFFATHDSKVIRSIAHDEMFEVGIHPNFAPDSTQGSNRHEVLNYCTKLFPNATSMRTHRLIQSTALFIELSQNYPKIQNDVSILCPFQPNLSSFLFYTSHTDTSIVRIPYFWEDDIAAYEPSWDWKLFTLRPGMKIFNFHPTFVALNTNTMDPYIQLNNKYKLPQCTEDDFENFINKTKHGTKTFLEECLQYFGGNLSKISDIGNRTRAGLCALR